MASLDNTCVKSIYKNKKRRETLVKFSLWKISISCNGNLWKSINSLRSYGSYAVELLKGDVIQCMTQA